MKINNLEVKIKPIDLKKFQPIMPMSLYNYFFRNIIYSKIIIIDRMKKYIEIRHKI